MKRVFEGMQTSTLFDRFFWRPAVFLLVVGLASAVPGIAPGAEAQWIWSPQHVRDKVPEGACYFRKSFSGQFPERAQISIAADDQYELYVNGHRIGSGRSSSQFDEYDITKQVKQGRNTIAVRVVNRVGTTAALAARVFVKERGGSWLTYSTDGTWQTNLRPFPLWNTTFYNDRLWDRAQVFGVLGSTAPWDHQEDVAARDTDQAERFRISREFEVQRVVSAEDTGSIIAMSFDEFGHIIASQEGGPLLLVYDSDDDDIVDKVRPYCDQVKNVQGILAINGRVYVTGDGPEGPALYRLMDKDHDGKLEDVHTLFRFEGELGEHTAHGITLGPDGWIYVVIGNHTKPLVTFAANSPYHDSYEGDLVQPRLEDPSGHAAGRKAPGGMIIRTDLEGQRVQLVAGGLRNTYDLAFDEQGNLFVHDSDMESDLGMTWYRPTRIYHAIPGAEFGWRSGWAKWPEYYLDSLPAAADTGRSSPTGCVFYNHFMFPNKYHGALFLADWSEGRILAVHLKPKGASYTAEAEIFLQGQPLNVTDLDVGPDGWLYFVTGGRGTGGGVYRVKWKGTVPDAVRDLGTGISPVIRQPQLESAWGRQRVAKLKQQIGDDWGPYLIGVVRSSMNPTKYRIRALNLMQLYGPTPSASLLIELSNDKNEMVRARTADLMGLHETGETRTRLIELLEDSDRMVRRRACEALARAGQTAPPDTLISMLGSDDRFEAWAARLLLEKSEPDTWRDQVLSSEDQRVFNRGALALLAVAPTEPNGLAVLDQTSQRMRAFISDRDFVEMMRVAEVAMSRCKIPPGSLQVLRDQLADEFPAGNAIMNRELIRLLAYLQADAITDRYIRYLGSDAPKEDRVHLAMYASYIRTGWTTQQKLQLIEFMSRAKGWDGGGSYAAYLGNAIRNFAKRMSASEGTLVLRRGEQWPDAVLGTLHTLPKKLDVGTRTALEHLDEAIDQKEDPSNKQLMVGIVAVLARDGQDASMAYLRKIWDRNPERRSPVAMGLAQSPAGDNWEYLLHSLPVVEGGTAREVMRSLKTVARIPDDPESLRQVILRGLELKEHGALDAVALLEHWVSLPQGESADGWDKKLAAWQAWFAESFPDYPPAELPKEPTESKWKFDDLQEFLSSDEGHAGDAARGAVVFEKSLCSKCHRYGDHGEAMGPDLTSIAKRFSRKEILQSLLYPSHVISSQYAAKTLLLTDGRQLSGIVAPGPEGEQVVLKSDGDKVSVPEQEIDEVHPSNVSAMPVALLDELSLEQIADLFAYLNSPPSQGVALRVED